MGHNFGTTLDKTFHLGYLKRTIGLRMQTLTDAVLSDTGHFPLQLGRNLNVIKYWLKMLNLQADDPLRNAFDTLVQLHNLGQVTNLLASLEISDPKFPELNLTDKNNKLFDTLKEKVYSTHMENCMARIKPNTEDKLRIFLTFKQDYCMEGYLLPFANLKHMSTIARLRMSSHTLAIETGRHAKPKIAKEERKCRYCNLDDVEYEEHFLLKCPMYSEECLSLFDSVVLNVSAMSQGDVFVYLLSNNRKNTGNFITQHIQEKGESDDPLPVLMYYFNVWQSSVAMLIDDVYCIDKYYIVKTPPLDTSRY